MTRNFEISEDKSAIRHCDVVVTALNWLNVATNIYWPNLWRSSWKERKIKQRSAEDERRMKKEEKKKKKRHILQCALT